MSTILINDSTMIDIAEAIRAKTQKSAKMSPSQMPQEINSIEVLNADNFTLQSSSAQATYVYPQEVSGVLSNQVIFTFTPRFSGTISFSFFRDGSQGTSTMTVNGQSVRLNSGSGGASNDGTTAVIKGVQYPVMISNTSSKLSTLKNITISAFIKTNDVFSIS